MAGYRQYTKCCSEAAYFDLGAAFVAVAVADLIVLVLGGITIPWVAFALILVGIAYCTWWLYSRLICNGGDECAMGFILKIEPPEDKSLIKPPLDAFDTDYSISIVPAPFRLGDRMSTVIFRPDHEDFEVQGRLIRQTEANKNHGHPFSADPINDDPKNEPSTAVLHCEFEGAGVLDLLLALLLALEFVAVAAVTCEIPIIGWIICLVAGVIALAIFIAGIFIALHDRGSPADAGAPAVLHQGDSADIVVVIGTWVYDSQHSGWNELHPVKQCQRIASIDGGMSPGLFNALFLATG